MAEVTDVGAERGAGDPWRRRAARLRQPDRRCGAQTSYFGHDEWQHVSCSLKPLGGALELRDRVYGAFVQAERARDRGRGTNG